MNAIQTLLTEHLDIWTDADTEKKSGRGRSAGNAASVYGIKKLRELILELAVRGKLVPQDSDWKSTCIGELGSWAVGSGFPTKEQGLLGLEILFAKVSDMNLPENAKFIATTNHTISRETANRLRVNIHPAGTVVFPKIGGAIATNKRRILLKPTAIDNNCLGLTPKDGVSTEWLFLFLTSIDFTLYQAGTSVPALAQGVLEEIPALLPPLAEQHRIVAKVDELMALCDQLETRHNNAAEAHEKLVSHLLATLTQSQNAADFSANWQRIAAHFDTLFTTESSIDTLKQTLLQLAVMGKLVPQDPSDENVEHILIRNDAKRREIARSDRRADVDLHSLLSAEDCWNIPEAWTWRGLGDLVLFVDYRGQTPPKLSDGVRLLTAKNVRKGQINLSPEEFLSEHDYREWMTRGLPQAGDVLFTTEAPMGNAAVVELTERFALAQRVICFQSYGALDSSFLVMQILSEEFQYLLDKNGTGVTAKGIKASKLKRLPIAVPPLAEQHRIVAKVDELMALCEQLNTRITEANQLQQKLADVVVKQALI